MTNLVLCLDLKSNLSFCSLVMFLAIVPTVPLIGLLSFFAKEKTTERQLFCLGTRQNHGLADEDSVSKQPFTSILPSGVVELLSMAPVFLR